MQKESLWSFSIRNVLRRDHDWSWCSSVLAFLPWNRVGIGISAIVLGALTATGLCVDEFCCSDSNPEEVPPGVTLGSPAVIYQPDR